ncbi:MAG: response regulator [Planctomycetes bacterium]|nr:response regulator [Planctomycetota bacterium]
MRVDRPRPRVLVLSRRDLRPALEGWEFVTSKEVTEAEPDLVVLDIPEAGAGEISVALSLCAAGSFLMTIGPEDQAPAGLHSDANVPLPLDMNAIRAQCEQLLRLRQFEQAAIRNSSIVAGLRGARKNRNTLDAIAGHYAALFQDIRRAAHDREEMLRAALERERGLRTGLKAELELRLEREEELRRKNDQLLQSQKLEAIGQLAGGVAHDFNNLLTAILGYSDVVLGRLSADDPARSDIEEIKKAGKRASEVTRGLLAFGRKQILSPEVLDLNAVVADMGKLLRRLITEAIEIVTVSRPGLGRVKADRVQMEQVIVNLVINARDAMPKGGKITIETANADIEEGSARGVEPPRPGLYVLLSVSDTGIGMDKEVIAHLFEPFFTTKEPGKGTGLGLATTYGIVKQSGGHIWVDSEPGRGSTFKVHLPRVAEAPDANGTTGPAAAPPRGSETVLVVEDEDAVRKLTCGLLRAWGYRVLEADGGACALRLCEQHGEPIHLLLTDVVMPRMSGTELADVLVRKRPGLRVLYCSGYTADVIVDHGIIHPAVAFLHKPFAPDALAGKVRQVLDMPALDPPPGPTPLTPGRPAEPDGPPRGP